MDISDKLFKERYLDRKKGLFYSSKKLESFKAKIQSDVSLPASILDFENKMAAFITEAEHYQNLYQIGWRTPKMTALVRMGSAQREQYYLIRSIIRYYRIPDDARYAGIKAKDKAEILDLFAVTIEYTKAAEKALKEATK